MQAEWWTQVIDPSDEIGLHWDRDYDMQADQGLLLHPMLATVTYLGTPPSAAPTVVLDRPSPLLASESACGPVSSSFVCWPQRGRHLAFDGKLLHGALPDLTPAGSAGGGGKRVTFLVNCWLNHVPWGAEELPKSVTRRLHALSKIQMALGAGQAVRTVSIKASKSVPSPPLLHWSFGEEKTKLRLSLPWPEEAVAAALVHGRKGRAAPPSAPFLRVAFGTGGELALAPKEKGKSKDKLAKAKANAAAEPEPDKKGNGKAEAKRDAKAKAKAEVKAKVEAKAKAEVKAKGKTEAKVEPKAKWRLQEEASAGGSTHKRGRSSEASLREKKRQR
uniref:Uncharacterized protein n=1 Tax=Haptolina brevifila TaxID=156173 RepID=A0A7S2J9B0_9EUKA|mmetsp:Transcript_78765/g.156629  ORF Transcript_78765/g.156629 Transcript_78765/m.156629 type:complete len:332 (+) Transcript_78765:518-1513(+)